MSLSVVGLYVVEECTSLNVNWNSELDDALLSDKLASILLDDQICNTADASANYNSMHRLAA